MKNSVLYYCCHYMVAAVLAGSLLTWSASALNQDVAKECELPPLPFQNLLDGMVFMHGQGSVFEQDCKLRLFRKEDYTWAFIPEVLGGQPTDIDLNKKRFFVMLLKNSGPDATVELELKNKLADGKEEPLIGGGDPPRVLLGVDQTYGCFRMLAYDLSSVLISEVTNRIARVLVFSNLDTDEITVAAIGFTATLPGPFFPQNEAPTISYIENKTIEVGKLPAPILFSVDDDRTQPGNLSISISSSNESLVPTNNISLGGFGSDRILTMQPIPGKIGTTTITIIVNDADSEFEKCSKSTFTLSVVTNQITEPLRIIRAARLTTNSWNKIVFLNNQFVAAGDNATIGISQDGLVWTVAATGFGVALNDVAYGSNQKYVAIGDKGTVLLSSDGIRWQLRSSNTTNNLNAVVYSGKEFLAVGDAGAILASVDGETWIRRESTVSNLLSGITFGNNQIIAVGNGRIVLTSVDGLVWAPHTVSVAGSNPNASFRSINYCQGAFYAVQDVFIPAGITSFTHGDVLRSEDGITWQAVESAGTLEEFQPGLASGAGLVLALQKHQVVITGSPSPSEPGQSSIQQVVHLSSNGTSWSEQEFEVHSGLRSIAYGAGRFVAAGIDGYVINIVPSDARIKIQRSGASVDISWTGEGRLQQAYKVTGPWTDVLEATNPTRIPIEIYQSRFFRLIR